MFSNIERTQKAVSFIDIYLQICCNYIAHRRIDLEICSGDFSAADNGANGQTDLYPLRMRVG